MLVTGGSGFIGTNAVERLTGLAGAVLSLDRAQPSMPEHLHLWRETDIRDSSALDAAVADFGPTHVVHLAARTDLHGASPDDYLANTEGTANLVRALATLDSTPRLIAASSRLVCKIGLRPRDDHDYSPPNAYGRSKVEMERLIRESSYPGSWVLIRPTSIWGPWFGEPYRDFFLAVAKGRYRHPAGRRILKSFGYVENTVDQIASLLGAPADAIHGRVFYLADYEPIEVGDWADLVRRATGGPEVKTLPVGLLRALAAGGDVLGRLGWRSPPLTSFRLANLLTEMLYDLDPIRRLAPELPVTLSEGVARTAEWLRSIGAIGRGATR